MKHNLTLFTPFLLLTILMSCSDNPSRKNYAIMGDLELGSHSVGYRTLFVYDKTQVGVPYADWEGRLYPNHKPELGRQHQINLWYPAVEGSGSNLKYEHYVHLMGRQTNFEETDSSKRFGEQIFLSRTNDLGADGNFGQSQLDTLIQLDVLARLEAKEAGGIFPVVLLPNGSNPAFHSITAEFLASHGYVVVGFAPKGRYSYGLEVSTIGLEKGVDDLEFVLSEVSSLPYVDMTRVAFAANAIFSSMNAAAISRNQKVKALISLEGGFPSAFDQRLLSKSVFYEAENITVPSLFIYAPHPAIDPKHTFHLTYSKRYYAHFPNMSEFVMLNYGMFDSFIPDIIGEHEGGTQVGFETANNLMLRFLNTHVKGEESDVLSDDFLAASQVSIDTSFVLDALPVAPNIAEMKALFIDHGFKSVDSTYQSLMSDGNPQPFSRTFYHDYRSWLAWKKDPEYTYRKALYTMGLASYPESARMNYYFAYYAKKTDDKITAVKHYRKALDLLDADEMLTASERKSIKDYAEQDLKELL